MFTYLIKFKRNKMIKQRALSLKHRVLIYFVLISVVAISSLSVGGVHFLEKTLLEKDLLTSNILAKEVHYNVNCVFEQAQRDMNLIVADPIIKGETHSVGKKLLKLKQLEELIGEFENISLLSLDGRILATTNFNYMGGEKYSRDFKKTRASKTTEVSPAYFTLDPKHIVFSFTAPVYANDGTMNYILCAQLNVNQVTAVIEHLDFGESGTAQLIDSYGRFIAGVNEVDLLRPVGKSIQDALDLAEQGFKYEKEGVRYGSAYQGARFTVLVSQSYSAVLSVIEESLNKLIIYTVLVLIVVVFVGIYFSYTISRPLDSLIENIKSYAKGDRYETSNSHTVPEEISILGESFNHMLGQIEVYQDEMQQLVINRTEELAHEKDRAEAANRTKTLFLKNMSHEIRTPMNAILGFTQLLKHKEVDSNKLALLKNIMSSGNTLLKMLNDLLDLSKQEAGKLEEQLSVIDLRKFFREIELSFLGPCSQKHLYIKFEYADNLPSFVLLDTLKLKQILGHLLDNAIKFTEKGGLTVSISSHIKKLESSSIDLVILVKDTGKGIEKNHQKQIFNVFERHESDDFNESSGVGIGLTLCKQLLDFLGGDLKLKSELGQGSIFEVRVPNIELAVNELDNLENVPVIDGVGFKVLVADNKEFNRESIKKVCAAYMCEIEEATNGIEVLRKSRNFVPDIIFLDLEISKLDGFEVLRILREDKHLKDIQIIAISTREQHRTLALEEGNGFILKPFSQLQIKHILDSFLKK